MIRVRDASIDDFDVILALSRIMHSESIEPYPPIETAHFRKFVELAIAAPEVVLFALAEEEGLVVGMITAVAGPYSFSPRLRTASDILFVLPDYRGGWAAARLVRRFTEWSVSVNADSATLSVATGVSPERTGRFFEAMGFSPMQKTYRKDLR